MNAVAVIDGKIEPVFCAIADAVLAEAIAAPVSALDRAEAALIAHRPILAAVKAEHDQADIAAIAARGTPEKAQADAVFDEVDDRWMATLRQRDGLVAAVLSVPVRTAADALRKQTIALIEHGCSDRLYDLTEETEVALTAALADLQTLSGMGPCEPEQVRDTLAGIMPPDPDAALHEAVKELDRRWTAERLAEADKLDDDALTAACDHTSTAAAAIMALPPAQTFAGLRIKARAIAWCFSEDKPEFACEHGHPTAADRWADRFFAELLTGAPV